MDTGEELPIVVDCVLQMDTVQTLRLYHMKRLSGEGYEPVADFHRSEGLLWETRFEPALGESYRLSITLPGREEISATTTFPEDMRLVLHHKYLHDGTGLFDSTRDTTYLKMISAEVATSR